MVKAHARAELDHSRRFCRGQSIDRNAQLRRRAQKQCSVADRLGRRDKQQLLSVGREGLDTTDEAFLDRSRRGPLTRDPEPAGELRRG